MSDPIRKVSLDANELGAPEYFSRFLDQFNPFVDDVSHAMSGNLDSSNLKRQIKETTLLTSTSVGTTFANGQVQIKSDIGRPTEVRCVIRPHSYTDSVFSKYADWTNVTYQNSWVDVASGWAPVSYRFKNGVVQCRGACKSGTISTSLPVFTLPSDLVPPYNMEWAVAGDAVYGSIAIKSTGEVYAVAGTNVSINLDGVEFEPASWVGTAIGNPVWDWVGNNVKILYISGLSPNTKYDITYVFE